MNDAHRFSIVSKKWRLEAIFRVVFHLGFGLKFANQAAPKAGSKEMPIGKNGYVANTSRLLLKKRAKEI